MFDKAFQGRWRARLNDAALWHVKIEEDQRIRESDGFRKWLRDDLNRRAFDRVSGAWNAIEVHSEAVAIKAIADHAVGRLSAPHRSLNFKNGWAWALSACAILMVAGAYISMRALADHPVVYSSGSNGLRVVDLSDGSRIWLDASSTVTVHSFTSSSRRLTLDSGRARFGVAHDQARPFSVNVGNETAIAVGTSFDVERLGDRILVTVTQGKVLEKSLRLDGASHAPVSLVKGQQLVAMRGGKVSVSRVDLDTVNAWQNGKIVFDDQPLDEAIEQLNRYLDKRISVAPAVAKIRVSGVFNIGDLPAFLGALTTYFPVEARKLDDGRMVIQGRSKAT